MAGKERRIIVNEEVVKGERGGEKGTKVLIEVDWSGLEWIGVDRCEERRGRRDQREEESKEDTSYETHHGACDSIDRCV